MDPFLFYLLSPGGSQLSHRAPQESGQNEQVFCLQELTKSPSSGPRDVFHPKLPSHNQVFTIWTGEIKPTHGCHISQIPSVDQTSQLWRKDIPASRLRAGWLPGLFLSYFLSCTLSLCCLCDADKSIHQKISSVKLNQERSCQRERNRLN